MSCQCEGDEHDQPGARIGKDQGTKPVQVDFFNGREGGLNIQTMLAQGLEGGNDVRDDLDDHTDAKYQAERCAVRFIGLILGR